MRFYHSTKSCFKILTLKISRIVKACLRNYLSCFCRRLFRSFFFFLYFLKQRHDEWSFIFPSTGTRVYPKQQFSSAPLNPIKITDAKMKILQFNSQWQLEKFIFVSTPQNLLQRYKILEINTKVNCL